MRTAVLRVCVLAAEKSTFERLLKPAISCQPACQTAVGRTVSQHGGVTWSAGCQNARTQQHSSLDDVRTARLLAYCSPLTFAR